MLFTALAAPETGGDFGGGPHCSPAVTPALLAPVTGRSAPLAVTGPVESAHRFRTLSGPGCPVENAEDRGDSAASGG